MIDSTDTTFTRTLLRACRASRELLRLAAETGTRRNLELARQLEPFLGEALVYLEDWEDERARWQAYIEQHPELAAESELTDDDVLDALRGAIESKPPHAAGAALSSDVAAALFVLGPLGSPSRHRQVGRVATRLRRLAADGLVVQLRGRLHPSTCAWTLPEFELSEQGRRSAPSRTEAV